MSHREPASITAQMPAHSLPHAAAETDQPARSHRGVSAGTAGRRREGRAVLTQLRGPFAGRYPAAAAMVMVALIPYLALSAALGPLTPIIAQQLHMSLQTMSLGSGMGNAAYAVGTVLAVQFAQHLPQRRMLVVYAVLLVIGSVLAAAAQNPGMFIAGHVLQGLCTSLLLIAAVPPLAIGFASSKLRETAVIMNMCIFGAVALGPVDRRPAGAGARLAARCSGSSPAISAAALVLAVLTFEDAPPADRRLAAGPAGDRAGGRRLRGRVLRRLRAAEPPLPGRSTFVPLLGGLALIVVLVVNQYRAQAAAADDPHDADQHDPGRGNRRGAVRGGSVGVGDRADRGPAGRRYSAAAPRAALPAGARRARCSRRSRSASSSAGARCTTSRCVGMVFLARRDRGVPHPGALHPGD